MKELTKNTDFVCSEIYIFQQNTTNYFWNYFETIMYFIVHVLYTHDFTLTSMHVLQDCGWYFILETIKLRVIVFYFWGLFSDKFSHKWLQSYLFGVSELEPAVDDRLLLRAGLLSHQLPALRLSFWLSQWTRLSHTARGRVVTSLRHPALRTKPDDRTRSQRIENNLSLRILTAN